MNATPSIFDSLRRVATHIPAPRPGWTVMSLALSDIASLLLALLLTALAIDPVFSVASHVALFPITMMLLAPLGYAVAGLYPATAVGPIAEFRQLGRVTIGVGIVGTLVLSLFNGLPATWLVLISGALAVVTVPLGRAATREVVARQPWWGEPVVILGAGETARLVIERCRRYPRLGMKPVACFDDDPNKVGGAVLGVPVAGTLSEVDTSIARGVLTAVIAMPGVAPHDLVRLVRRHAHGFRSVVVVPNLFGLRTIGVETRDLGGVLGLHVRHNLIDPVNRITKRLLDILLVIPALLVGIPLMIAAAAAIVIVSPGSPFFYQTRIGIDGRPFRVWKLRTMYVDAFERLEEHLENDPRAKAEWVQHFKLQDDPRILPVVGPFLRRSSLDELPQILNVLRGDMSFIGPRPFPEYHLAAFSDEFRELRSSVRPGITGLWQVSSRSDGDLEVQRDTDTYYIRNWSVWMDLYILARTPLAVLLARGAR